VHQDTSQSVIYNLLTILSSGGHDRSPTSPKNSTVVSDQISIHSSISGMSRNEEQRRQMYENIVCTVTGVACILKDNDVLIIMFYCFNYYYIIIHYLYCFS
jgi:hypothetical protein